MSRSSRNLADVVRIDPEIGFVVHSHLRWDFVWQRPQQLLSRIARHNPVFFLEEPIWVEDGSAPSLEIGEPLPGVIRAVPRLPQSESDSADGAFVLVRQLMQPALREAPLARRFRRSVQWFYTPMPAPDMLGALDEEAVVYDCMDELSQFRYAPTDIARRERLLLSRADVVFTGGCRLYEAKSRYHDNVHFFGCGVDASHFGKARDEATQIPHDVAGLSHPVLGYFGVIDERLDYDLLRALSKARPEWTILMIGPVVKVAPHELPSASNIVWLGQRGYQDLPAYVKAFDVCLMPFALNEATEFINPTKTLEYMAAGRPIVSTPVADVVRNFSPIVRVAKSAPEFIEAAEEAVDDPDGTRIGAGIEKANGASWESIVARMRSLIALSIAEKNGALRAAGAVTELARNGTSTAEQVAAAGRASGRPMRAARHT